MLKMIASFFAYLWDALCGIFRKREQQEVAKQVEQIEKTHHVEKEIENAQKPEPAKPDPAGGINFDDWNRGGVQ